MQDSLRNKKLKKIQKIRKVYAIALANLANLDELCNIEEQVNRRWWVRPINTRRDTQGFYNNLIQEIKNDDPEMFFAFTRMNVSQFDHLVQLVGKKLQKYSARTPIPVEARVLLTLRYLATGESHQSLSFAFRIGRSTVQRIISESCKVFWEVLQPIYLPQPYANDITMGVRQQ